MIKKILFLLIVVYINAETLSFILPLDDNKTNKIEKNSTKKLNNLNDTNETYTNLISNNFKIQIIEKEEDFNDTYISLNNKINFAIMIDKNKFFKYIPTIINSLNAYLSQKGIDFSFKVYNIDKNLSEINSTDIIYITTDKKRIHKLIDYNKTFYIPTFTKNDFNITSDNLYFGSINFISQLNILTKFIDDKTYIIADKTELSKKLTAYEKNLSFVKNIYYYPNIYYQDLNNSFVIFNTNSGKTAQVLSKITQKEINTKLNLITQIGYDPLLILLTQKTDIQKLLIANSIINPPLIINEYTHLLNSDIKYNWLNYAVCIFANKIYNKQNSEDMFYMNDFNIYIFNNEINYHTKLYRIINGAFKEVK